MNELHFAYAVARIRCNELNLLTSADFEQLISAQDYKSAVAFLNDKGWELDEKSDSNAEAFAKKREEAWALIQSSLGDVSPLNSVVVFHDFHNLKAALKAKFTGVEAQKYFLSPCVANPNELLEAVESHRFDKLPDFLREGAQEAYDILVQTGNGQRADLVLDCAAMRASVAMAKESKSAMLVTLAETTADCADAKTAFRCYRTGKDEKFIEQALSGCGKLDKSSLVKAALSAVEEIAQVLEFGGYPLLAQSLLKDSVSFEKECDDALLTVYLQAKNQAFGMEPIVAYYLACESQIKNVRILLSGKLNRLDQGEIERRVRSLYV
ncbi:MAG TPA: hypothetical protein DDY98_07515 [Ruminococcaceae bacterium]|nr:hypothetical protein [Oscillospiraceae bacterium]